MRNRRWLLAGLPLWGLVQALWGPAVSAKGPGLVAVADSGQFPLRYCTLLPRTDFAHWDADYERYDRLLTPEIRRTQVGLRLVDKNGVHIWSCRPAANALPQLDTLTRVADPARLQGRWRSLANRLVRYRDSAVLGERRIYRSVQPVPMEFEQAEMLLADGRLTLLASKKPGGTLQKQFSKRYDVVNGRYLLVYGLSRASAAINQVGLDAQGRLLLHSYAVVERKIPDQYQTYETLLSQTIFEQVP